MSAGVSTLAIADPRIDDRVDDGERDPDEEGDAGEDRRRQDAGPDDAGDRLAVRRRGPEVAVEDAVITAAEEARQEVGDATVADENAQTLAVRVAHTEPSAVLDRDRL